MGNQVSQGEKFVFGEETSPSNNNDNEEDENKINEKQLKLITTLDYIATKYITQQKFTDLENLHNKEFCNKLIILTSKIIKKHFSGLEIDFLEQRTHYGNEINMMNKDKIVYAKKEGLEQADEKSSVRKKRMCDGIAKFYVKIAHLFAAISKTINPVYSYTDADGNKKQVPLLMKSSIPKNSQVNVIKYNLCERRLTALEPKEDNGVISINPKICNFNKNESFIMVGGEPVVPQVEEVSQFQINNNKVLENIINPEKEEPKPIEDKPEPTQENPEPTQENPEPIQEKPEPTQENPEPTQDKPEPTQDKPEPTQEVQSDYVENINFKSEGPKKSKGYIKPTQMGDKPKLIHEPGIPELEKLYNDEYSFVKAKYSGRTPKSQEAYNADLKTFYTAFTGNKEIPDTIQKFSDIPLNNYEEFPQCKSGEFQLKYDSNKYKEIVGNTSLFEQYGKHYKNMFDKTKKTENELLGILENVFVFLVDKKTKKKTLILNPTLNVEKLDELIIKARETIVKMYIECEKDFIEGVKIFNSIITEINIKTNKQRGENLKKLEMSIIGEDETKIQENPEKKELPKTEDELNEINEFIQRKKQNMEDGKQVNVELISDEPIKA